MGISGCHYFRGNPRWYEEYFGEQDHSYDEKGKIFRRIEFQSNRFGGIVMIGYKVDGWKRVGKFVDLRISKEAG